MIWPSAAQLQHPPFCAHTMPPAQRRIARATSTWSEDQETIDINNVSDSEPKPDPHAEHVTQGHLAIFYLMAPS